MQVVLIILSVGLLGAIIYFAFSSKSSKLLKLAALIALGLIALSIGICSFFLIKGPGEPDVVIPFPVFEQTEQPARKSNTPAVIGFLVVFLVILGLISFVALRGQNKPKDQNKKTEIPKKAAPIPFPVLSDALDLDLSFGEPREPDTHPDKKDGNSDTGAE